MHYIRLLRPAKILTSTGRLVISILFTITTDLGDSFLCPEDGSIDLIVAVEDPAAGPVRSGAAVLRGAKTCRYKWKTGMRVLDANFTLAPGLKKELVNCRFSIYPVQQRPRKPSAPLGALHVGDVLPWTVDMNPILRMGVIMPATFEFVDGVCATVSVRTLGLRMHHGAGERGESDESLNLQFEEDIGESIARHIWDAGVVTSAYLADASSSPESIREVLPIERDSFNVLELGSGVGILGITIATILPAAAVAQGRRLKNSRVLLTDLEEAEERARSNIAKAEATLATSHTEGANVTIEYENLDWDEGLEGRFGPLVSATPWDLIVLSDCTYNVDSLPALVGTLSALHTLKEHHRDQENKGPAKSSVLLATKPRHSSEEALFELLDDQSWTYRVVKEIPLPKIGEEDEVVQVYLLQKGALGT
ncbi:putative methyltransferase-domain-containing protein [Xylaria bambusicola]|uniref:putative methyltransferase-domain-containing protein n=1 Tax=Xylaria bambusicola TaxID=326684 RepID=UPI0020079EBC|nr:putative methyltransferase-domain-containing protein [Xylaria bambusicola]KAI0506533.1 putative methyltransferase-domain-containing protein [Xylaria bambusicola]